MPQEWPAWQTVNGYFRRWRLDGTWERIHRALRQRLRLQLHRAPGPIVGSVYSQSVKTTDVGGARGEATRARLPRMQLLWLDAGYNGRGKGRDWVEQVTGWRVETVKAIHRYKRYWVPDDISPDQIDWSKYPP